MILDEHVRINRLPEVFEPGPVGVHGITIDGQGTLSLEEAHRHFLDEPLVAGVQAGSQNVIVAVDDHAAVETLVKG